MKSQSWSLTDTIKRKPSTAFEILVAVAEEGISKEGPAQICRTVEQALNELREEDAKILVLQLGLKEISRFEEDVKRTVLALVTQLLKNLLLQGKK